MTEKYQPIPHRLKNMAVGGHVAGAVDIFDDLKDKDQQTINAEQDLTNQQTAIDIDDLNVDFENLEDLVNEKQMEIGATEFDIRPKSESTHPVTSGGIYTHNIEAEIVVGDPQNEWQPATAEALFERCQEAISRLNGNEVIPVADHTAVSNPDGNKIYREQGTDSYTDWMYYDNAWYPIATYEFPGIDDEPVPDSENLVKSGGVAKTISRTPSDMYHNADFVDELGHILTFLDKDGWWNFPSMGIESLEFDTRGEESEYKILIVDSFNHVLAYRKPNENYVVVKENDTSTAVYDRNLDTINIALGVAGIPDHNRLQFMIVADTHTYPNAYVNAMSIAEKLPQCAAVIHLGDVNNQVGVTGDVEEYFRKMFAENKMILPVVGNHDVGEYDRLLVHVSVDKLLYNCMIQPMINKGYLSSGEYVQDKLYYYKDFPTQKVRLIVLDNYNGSETLASNDYWEPILYNSTYDNISQKAYTAGDCVNIKGYDKYSFECISNVTVKYSNKTTSPSIKEYRRCCWYSEAQLNWLCDTLVDAAQNEYMCVIASHQACVFPNVVDFDSEFTSQYAGDSIGGYMSRFDENNITIIRDIVKAFYGKGSITKHMEAISSEAVGDDADDASSEPVFDFSYNFGESEYEPTRVTFIHGHNHRDSVCVPSDTETYSHQVSIGFTNSDTTRSTRNNVGLSTKTNEDNDILTTYTILDDSHVHLCRIGRNITDRIVNGKVVVKDNQIVEI